MAKRLRKRRRRHYLTGDIDGGQFDLLDIHTLKYNKYRCSRFKFKYERDAIAHLNKTKRGVGKNFAQMKSRHSNYEWIWLEPVE